MIPEYVRPEDVEITTVEQPYDEYERELLARIEEINQRAYNEADPYRVKFMQSRLRKVPKYYMHIKKRGMPPEA